MPGKAGEPPGEHRRYISYRAAHYHAGGIGGILREYGAAEEQVAAFQARCAQQLGSGTSFNPASLIDAGRFEVKVAGTMISVTPERGCLVETRVIDRCRLNKNTASPCQALAELI